MTNVTTNPPPGNVPTELQTMEDCLALLSRLQLLVGVNPNDEPTSLCKRLRLRLLFLVSQHTDCSPSRLIQALRQSEELSRDLRRVQSRDPGYIRFL